MHKNTPWTPLEIIALILGLLLSLCLLSGLN